MNRRIPMEHMLNLRDLGGYPAESGSFTAWKRIYRSDVPHGLSSQEIRWFQDKGVRTVIDLRSDEEVRRNPVSLKDVDGIDYLHVNLMNQKDLTAAAALLKGGEGVLGRMYEEIAQMHSQMRQVMEAIAYAPGAVLYHCSAGKDRTGVISAILMSLAGVQPADIVADYQVSYTYLEESVKKMRADYPELPAYLMESRPEIMQGFLRFFFEKYGSAHDYLKEIGLTEESIEQLRKRMLGV